MRLLALAAACTLVGCAGQRNADTAQTKMIGLTKPQVLACMGAPQNRMAEGNVDVWSYAGAEGGQAVILPGPAGAPMLAQNRPLDCVVNVTFTDTAVSRVSYRANGSLLNPQRACGPLVAGCL